MGHTRGDTALTLGNTSKFASVRLADIRVGQPVDIAFLGRSEHFGEH